MPAFRVYEINPRNQMVTVSVLLTILNCALYLKISVPCCRWFGHYSITAKDDVHLIEIFFFWGGGALRGRDNDNNDDDDWDNDPDDYLHFHVFPKVLALDLHGGTVKLLGSFLQDKKM